MNTPLVSAPDAAKLLLISLRQLQLMGDKGPPRIQISERRVAYRRDDIIQWIDARPQAPATLGRPAL